MAVQQNPIDTNEWNSNHDHRLTSIRPCVLAGSIWKGMPPASLLQPHPPWNFWSQQACIATKLALPPIVDQATCCKGDGLRKVCVGSMNFRMLQNLLQTEVLSSLQLSTNRVKGKWRLPSMPAPELLFPPSVCMPRINLGNNESL